MDFKMYENRVIMSWIDLTRIFNHEDIGEL